MKLWAPTSNRFSGARVVIRLAIFLGVYGIRYMLARTICFWIAHLIRDYEKCKVHSQKLIMTMEKQPFEDVWSY